MRLVTSGLFIFAFVAGAFAQQQTWTLQDCISYAHENNLTIKREELNTQLAVEDYEQSRFDLLPNLNFGANHDISSGRSLNLETYEYENRKIQQGSVGLRSRVTVFSGLENLNNIQKQKFLFMKSEEDLKKVKNDISLSIATNYLQILFDEEILEVAKSQYEVTRLQVERTERLVEVGNVAKGELLEIKAQAATEKLNVTNAENNLHLSVLDLTQLLDLDSIGNFTIYRPEDLSVESLGLPAPVDKVFETSLMVMPEIQGSGYFVQSAEKDLAIARSQRWPELYLDGLYYSRYVNGLMNPLDTIPPFDDYLLTDQIVDNQYRQLTVGIAIPLFNRFNTQTQISKSKINLEDAELQRELARQSLYKTIQQSHADALAALEKYNSAFEAVSSNEEAFNYTQQKFEVGLVNSVDFNIAKNNLTRARSDLVQAKFEYIFKMKILDFYQGKPISL